MIFHFPKVSGFGELLFRKIVTLNLLLNSLFTETTVFTVRSDILKENSSTNSIFDGGFVVWHRSAACYTYIPRRVLFYKNWKSLSPSKVWWQNNKIKFFSVKSKKFRILFIEISIKLDQYIMKMNIISYIATCGSHVRYLYQFKMQIKWNTTSPTATVLWFSSQAFLNLNSKT